MNDPIRVVQVFAEMNRGGAETMIMNLYRHIDRTRVQFDFVVHTQEKCAFDDEIEQLGGRIHRVPKYTGKNHFSYKLAWENFFISHPEYKIIHGHVRSTASIYLKIAKKYRLTTIAHSHNTSSGTGITSFVKNLMQYPIRYVSDYFLACSQTAGKWLFGDRVVSSCNFNILNNAIEIERFTFDKQVRNTIRKEFGIEGKFVIGHIGRFHPQKNHDFLIDIFKSIHDEVEDSVLLLVGDGPLKKSIQEKVNQINLGDSVIFTGVRSDVSDVFQGIDLFLFPSHFEGLGIVAVEAQASGLHAVVSENIPDEAYVTDLIENELLSSSPSQWANRILKYVDYYNRKDVSEIIKEKGFDIHKTSKWIQTYYLNISLDKERASK